MQKQHYVYILSNKSRSTIYIGITSGLVKRITEHREGIYSTDSSSFTSKNNCKDLIYVEQLSNPEESIAREKQLKGWGRTKKWQLILSLNPEMKDLSDLL
jgi:putative endonuclease